MINQLTQILTPVGRLVQGDCFVPQTTDSEGKPLLIKNGPNASQPRVDYYMAIAIPKTDIGYNEVWAAIHGTARAAFPSLFDAAGNCINPKFAFKVTDGDSQVPNSKGAKPCDKEGFPGNWILGFSGGFAPKCYTAGGAELITNPEMLKRGYYVRIYGSVKGNGSMQQPGVVLNHSMIELVGYGEEINSGPNGGTVFGDSVAALPAGASATPLAGNAPIAQVAPTPMPGALAPTPTAAPAPGQAAATPTAAPAPGQAAATPAPIVQPAPDFLNGPAATPAPAVAPAPAATPAPVEVKYLDANGTAFTEAQLLAAGYQPVQIQALVRA